jgi:hypothetical protein
MILTSEMEFKPAGVYFVQEQRQPLPDTLVSILDMLGSEPSKLQDFLPARLLLAGKKG